MKEKSTSAGAKKTDHINDGDERLLESVSERISIDLSFESQKRIVGAPAAAEGMVRQYPGSIKKLENYFIVLVGILVPKPTDDFYPWPFYIEAIPPPDKAVLTPNPSVAPSIGDIASVTLTAPAHSTVKPKDARRIGSSVIFEYEGPEPTIKLGPAAVIQTYWHPRGGIAVDPAWVNYRCYQLWRQIVIAEDSFAIGELRWHPDTGQRTLIEVLAPTKAKARNISITWKGIKVLLALCQRGRPIGTGQFRNKEELSSRVKEVIRALRQEHRIITQGEVGIDLGYVPKYFSDLLEQHGLNFKELEAESSK